MTQREEVHPVFTYFKSQFHQDVNSHPERRNLNEICFLEETRRHPIYYQWRLKMKKTRNFTSFVLCAVAFVGFSTIEVENAYCSDGPTYIGEYCWLTESGASLRIGITLVGDGHFSACGTASQAGLEWNINGNLELIGGNVVITFTDAVTYDGGATMMSRVGDAVLDLSTLDGTANFLEMRWEAGVTSVNHYSEGLTSVDCDPDLPQDGLDMREELIRFLKTYSKTTEESVY
jgi:hypothetical protein